MPAKRKPTDQDARREKQNQFIDDLFDHLSKMVDTFTQRPAPFAVPLGTYTMPEPPSPEQIAALEEHEKQLTERELLKHFFFGCLCAGLTPPEAFERATEAVKEWKKQCPPLPRPDFWANRPVYPVRTM
jgi:hypothetical protein